ncbi:DoxX family protein [Methyloterricola oryzae]|uniref:DoxX family protein n=1 Tax=Methyloterricola oryzae TaxID=1495050 RepID=UPI000AF7037A|nr:DoxX family protein [Methyloterricola oryzae]
MSVQMTSSLGLSKTTLNNYLNLISRRLDQLSPVGDLILRLWVAYAFWTAGLTKIQSWDSTLYLFDQEYSVPFLPSEIAAYLGTSVELAFPVLLAFGLFGRWAAGVLFLFNIIAVVSYPDLGVAGLEQHEIWGIMLLVCLLHGPGMLSLDRLIHRNGLATGR